MSYRGEDLDLRTPKAWGGAPADLLGTAPTEAYFNGPRGRSPAPLVAPGGPIWVDDTVLACCNHAFDVALAHRSAEVRLEHLIYALTRLEAAAEALEARGVRVPTLRREIATMIASDIPVGLLPGHAAPRRSDDLEEVLRLAAANAYRRHAPASVADIVHVIFDGPQELSSLAVVRRALPGLAAGMELASARPVSGLRSEAVTANGSFGSRLDSLEQMVRGLSNDLSSEQKTLLGVLQNLQRELMAQREESGRLGGAYQDKVLGERLQSLESMMSARPSSGSEMTFLSDRLGALERSLQAELAHIRMALEALPARSDGRIDLSPITTRIDALEEALLSSDGSKALEDRIDANRASTAEGLKALAEVVERQRSEVVPAVTTAVITAASERFDHLGGALATLQADMVRLVSGLGDRMYAFEQTLAEHVRHAEDAQGSYAHELGVLQEALVKLNANQHTLAGTIEARGQEASRSFATVAGRLEGLEQASARPIQMLEVMSGAMEKMHRVTVEKYYRRNRLWYWLFGTDDWVAASWPSQSARITEELQQIQTSLEK